MQQLIRKLSYASRVHDLFGYMLFDKDRELPSGWLICDGTNGTLDLTKEAEKVHPTLIYVTKEVY